VGLDDGTADRQPHAEPVGLGGEERLEMETLERLILVVSHAGRIPEKQAEENERSRRQRRRQYQHLFEVRSLTQVNFTRSMKGAKVFRNSIAQYRCVSGVLRPTGATTVKRQRFALVRQGHRARCFLNHPHRGVNKDGGDEQPDKNVRPRRACHRNQGCGHQDASVADDVVS